MSLSEDIGKLNYEVRGFLDSILEVTIYEGRIKDDPKYWEIKFNGLDTPLKIEAEDLDSSKAFRRKYLKLTNMPAPPLSTTDWYIVLKALGENANHGQYVEESDNVYVTETLFERIRELQQIKMDSALKAKGYVLYNGYRCIHYNTIKDLMEALNFKLTPRILSDTLTQMGYKEPGTPAIWVKELNKVVRFWWFKAEKFESPKGELV